jgi:hypothetical protein
MTMWIEQHGTVMVWFLDEPLDLQAPPGLEWMTAEELDGYHLLYAATIETATTADLAASRHHDPPP